MYSQKTNTDCFYKYWTPQVPHRQAALRHAAEPREKQRGRPLPGASVWHRPSRGETDSPLPGETLQGGQVRPGQVQLQLPGEVRQWECGLWGQGWQGEERGKCQFLKGFYWWEFEFEFEFEFKEISVREDDRINDGNVALHWERQTLDR